MEELKPCPLCDHPAQIKEFEEDYQTWYTPECTYCYLTVDNGYRTVEDAVGAWNERTVEDALRSEIKRLKANLAWGLEIVTRGVEIITDEQLSQWEGVRAWMELGTE